MITIRKDTNNARELLLRLGMGNYNATLAIQYMFTAPAATDPDMPSIILMTKHLQQGLRAAGATDVQVTGQIDDPTARALIRLVGPDWNQVTWYALFTAVIEAKRAGTLVTSGPAVQLGVLPDLPAVPGGMMTLALGAVAIYFILRKRKA